MRQLLKGVLLIISSQLIGQNIDSRLIGIEKTIDNLMNQNQTIGMSISIIENGKTIYSNGFGYRNLKKKLPVNQNTIFPIGSITKPFTASLIGILKSNKKLKLTDKPKQYIPYLQFSTDEMNNLINIEDLLAHRSGIGVVDATHVFFPTNNIKKHIERLSFLKPNSQVREQFDYSNMGYAVLGEIIAKISRKTWAENLKDEIFIPLEMNNSNSSLKELKLSNNHSLGYGLSKGNIIRTEYENQYESYASGAINSCVYDLSNWVKMLLNKGTYKGIEILSKSYLESSFSEHNIIRGSFNFDRKYNLISDTYGYGWFVHQYKNLYRVTHEGNVSGFTSSVNLYPYKNIGIIILANQGSSNLLLKAINDILINRLLGKERKHWKNYKIQIGESIVPQLVLNSPKTEKAPTHKLKDYCGKYFSKGYGIVEIFLKNKNLMIKFPTFTMFLEHQKHNTFINKVSQIHHQNTPSFYINFHPNNDGEIDKLTIAFSENPEQFLRLK